MRWLRLYVKGTVAEMHEAAAKHGVSVSVIERTGATPQAMVTLLVETTYLAKVSAWFAAPPLTAPYPVGTLLHWSEVRPHACPLCGVREQLAAAAVRNGRAALRDGAVPAGA